MRNFRGMIGNCFMHLFSILPLQDKVVFSSFGGNNSDDNPGEIYQQFLKTHPELKYIWLMNKPEVKIDGATVIRAISIKALYHLSTAKLWIDNSRKREWVVKRKNQYYVQTWHGDVCIKKIEKDAENELGTWYVQNAKHDSKMADLMLSGSRFRTNNFRNAFWYDGKILEYGTPKAEVFYRDPKPITENVKKRLGIPEDAKLALYCPTFRSNNTLDVYNVDYERLLEALNLRWPGQWYVAVRLHPKIRMLQNQIQYTERIINGSTIPFTNELVIASDLIISDYSGCLFAGLEAQKRVLIYAPDIDEYIRSERGLYFDFKSLPFPLAKNNDELNENITRFDDMKYSTQARALYEWIGYMTTADTTERIVDYIYSESIGKRS